MHAHEIFRAVNDRETERVVAAIREQPALAAARDPYLGSTPLHFAAHRGLAEIVDALLAAGADVHAREAASDSTALHWAAEGGHAAIAQRLLDRGADRETRDGWHALTPLGWATIVRWAPQYHDDKPGTAAALLRAGARLDPFTAIATGRLDALAAMDGASAARLGFLQDGVTPLHFAVACRSADAVRATIARGADVHARSLSGLTPLALAVRGQDVATAALLRELGARDDASTAVAMRDAAALAAAPDGGPLDDLLFVAAADGDATIVRALVGRGARPAARARRLIGEIPFDVTPLVVACQRRHVEAARALLDAGADASAGSADRTPTPLHVAAGEGDVALVRLLLDRGADRTATERCFGATPRGWAEHACQAEAAALL